MADQEEDAGEFTVPHAQKPHQAAPREIIVNSLDSTDIFPDKGNRTMKACKYTRTLAGILLTMAAINACGQPAFTRLHSFSSRPDGERPAGLVLCGNTLYGTTYLGGVADHMSSGNGTVFALNTNGTSYQVVHTFSARPTGASTNQDGATPFFSSLLLSGSTLYGTTTAGGANGGGTIFSIKTNGGYSVIYNFNSGQSARGTLLLSGNSLYGTTYFGGAFSYGSVFSVSTNGSNFQLLHSFSPRGSVGPYTNADGSLPEAGLLLLGNTLYGTASEGGAFGYGSVFSVKTTGTDFTVLHNFAATNPSASLTNADGLYPGTSLIVSNNTLYGTTKFGGTNGWGTVFSINTNGSEFNVLHHFTGGADGLSPSTPLVISGSMLYGATTGGGTSDRGTVFAVNADGSGFIVLGNLSNVGNRCNIPASLVVLSNMLFGTTKTGGVNNYGTVFSLELPVKPTISIQPQSLTVTNGNSASLFVTASGSPTLTYQWRFDGNNIIGATNSVYSITDAAIADTGSYAVVIANYYGSSITSALATLTVLMPPSITQQPQSQTVTVGSNTVITVTAEGAPLYYQWFKNGLAISNATQPAIIFDPVSLNESGNYWVVVSNVLGMATSSNAALAVRLPGSPIIRVNGQLVTGSVTNVGMATVTMSSGYSNGVVFYTLDGSTPGFGSPIYALPIVLTSNAVVRALGLNVDTFDSAEAPVVPVSILFPVTATTAGGGSVTVNPNQALHLSGSVPSVSATPSVGWMFLHWQGDANGTANPLNLPVTGPKNVSAVFGTTLQTGAIGSGTIELSETNLIPYGTLIRATAIPNSGSYFAQWGSALTGTNSPAWFSVVSTNPVRAVFGTLQAGQAALSVRIVGAGSVSVNPQQQVYAVNDNVTLTATQQDEYYGFNGWSGDASSTTNPLSLTLSSSKVVTANFSLLPPTLGISQQGSNVVLNWPAVYSNYFLLDAVSLAGGTWNTNAGVQTNVGGNISTVVPTTNSQMFYRLSTGQ